MTEVVARAVRVTKRFEANAAPALDAVNIEVMAGLMTGLVGPDGAGKTTLIRLLAGLLDPDEGEVTLLGEPAVAADRSALGYMPQRFGLYADSCDGAQPISYDGAQRSWIIAISCGHPVDIGWVSFS